MYVTVIFYDEVGFPFSSPSIPSLLALVARFSLIFSYKQKIPPHHTND